MQECQLPGCSKSVYVDSRCNRVFDHCCKGHAHLHRNISQPASSSAADISDFQQQCLLPGCGLLASVDTTTGVGYDYCSKDHANEAALRKLGAAPKIGSTTTTIDHSGLRAPSSGGGVACQAHSSGAANSTTRSVAGGTSPESSTQAPTRAAMGRTVGIVRISAFAQAAPPPPSASSASGPFGRPSAMKSGQCQLDGCAKLRAIDTITGQTYDFCCKHHAQQAKNAGKAGLLNNSGVFSAVPGLAVCMLPGCMKPPASGYDHCCKGHALEARKYTPMCTLRGCVKDAWFDPTLKQVKNLRLEQVPLRLPTQRFLRRLLPTTVDRTMKLFLEVWLE